ncbi:MAG: glycosyltransferase [Mogibacterium sp.]|nr:glycosyltransferase [Mogibacterium sp.]
MKYSVVIPCYNSSHTISDVVSLTADEFGRLGIDDFEFILVDDYSPDGGATMEVLRGLAASRPYVTVVELARNTGQHNAVMAGLAYAAGDLIITMDDDMQTHPSQLGKLLEAAKDHDVVYGYYPEKHHSAFRNFGSWVNFMTVRILIGKPRDLKTSSYCVMKRYVRDNMVEYHAQYSHLQGLILRIVSPDKIASVPIEHFDRAYGTSNYTLKKLIGLWSNIAGFSIVPLQITKRCGIAISMIGIIGTIILLIQKIVHPAVVLGWTSMIVAIFFFSGILLFTIGMVGEYVGRMFLAMGNYPQYVVRKVHTTDPERIRAGGNARIISGMRPGSITPDDSSDEQK